MINNGGFHDEYLDIHCHLLLMLMMARYYGRCAGFAQALRGLVQPQQPPLFGGLFPRFSGTGKGAVSAAL